jgi:hypothetical protein
VIKISFFFYIWFLQPADREGWMWGPIVSIIVRCSHIDTEMFCTNGNLPLNWWLWGLKTLQKTLVAECKASRQLIPRPTILLDPEPFASTFHLPSVRLILMLFSHDLNSIAARILCALLNLS